MPTSIDLLSYVFLTNAINEIKSPNQFLKRLLFGNHIPIPTESIEIGLYVGGRQIAPLVKKNGEAVMVEGLGQKFVNVTTPNIRIKRPFTSSQVTSQRIPGFTIYEGAEGIRAAANRVVQNDIQFMADQITNSEEYLCSLAITGTITYSVSEHESFKVTFGKPAGNIITLTGTDLWDDATVTNPRPEKNFMDAKRLTSEEGINLTDCILGAEASVQFMRLMKGQGHQLLDLRDLTAGQVTFESQFTEDGVNFLGRFGGLRVWEYARKVLVNGSSTDLIRPKYAEFVSATSAAENVIYYGSIADWSATGGLFIGERFSKTWREEDPSVLMHLAHSRPLPVTRRPAANVSMKVVSG